MHSQAGNTLRGTTFNQFTDPSPFTFKQMFRKQPNRSLEEIDTLFMRQEQIKNMIGEETATQIEQNPDLFYNHEKFRQWQAKARFRAVATTAITVPIIFTGLTGGRNGVSYAKSHPLAAVGIIVSTFIGSFYTWHRAVGYNSRVSLEQAYAKNHKMLRNVLIQQ